LGPLESRLRRLEERRNGGLCLECNLPPDGPGYIVLIDEQHPEKSIEGDPEERCGRCGRSLYTVLRVVYEDAGEGVSPIEQMHGHQAQRREV
jgi:hypothetical protein